MAPPPRSEATAREIRFAFRPSEGPASAYAMRDREDQHRIVLLPGVQKGGAYPIVVGLHGQPKRGTSPREYRFASEVLSEAERLVGTGEIRPIVMALPVFRFEGENWPGFDLREFQKKVEAVLSAEPISPLGYYVFGHSGAAGCGGSGLNRAARMAPRAAGFFDTCVGEGFGRAVRDLTVANVPTLLVHSVETAGFLPRQRPEYRTDFDFGAVYEPLGLAAIPCSGERPDAPPRKQPFACAQTPDGIVRAFVVDTGEGQAAHDEALRVGVRHFLRTMLPKP